MQVHLPPMVIYDRQRLTNVLMKNEVPGTLYGLSKKGWINRELFLKWFQRHFLTHAPPARPLLLLLDGHSSHYAPDLVRLAAQAGVILFVLPPNTTHFVQPLDKTVFGPLKVYWWQECQNFMARNPGTVITRGDFNEIFSRAWFHGLTSANVLSAFKATGIHPLDRYAVQIPGEDNKKKTLPAKASSDIAFLPLYSPAPRHKHCQSIAEKRSTTSSLDLSQCSQQLSTSSPTYQPLSIASLDTWSDDDDEEMVHSESGYELLDHSLHPSSIDSGNGQFHDGFTDDEVNRFNVRFENGYDLKSDTRYNLWKQMYHPESTNQSSPSQHTCITTAKPSTAKPSTANQLQVDKPNQSQILKLPRVVNLSKGNQFLSELLKISTPPARLKPPTAKSKSSQVLKT